MSQDDSNIAMVEDINRTRATTGMVTVTRERSYTSPETESAVIGVPGTLRNPQPVKKMAVVDLKSSIAAINSMVDELSATPDKPSFSNLSHDQWQNQLAIEITNLSSAAQGLMDITNNPQTLTRNILDERAKNVANHIDQVVMAAKNTALTGREPNYSLISAARTVAECLKVSSL